MGPDIAIVVGGWAFALGLLIWSEHNWAPLARWLLRAAVFTAAVMLTLHGRYDLTPMTCLVVFAAGLLLAGLPIVHELIFHVRTRQ